jgi:hypothetical protein
MSYYGITIKVAGQNVQHAYRKREMHTNLWPEYLRRDHFDDLVTGYMMGFKETELQSTDWICLAALVLIQNKIYLYHPTPTPHPRVWTPSLHASEIKGLCFAEILTAFLCNLKVFFPTLHCTPVLNPAHVKMETTRYSETAKQTYCSNGVGTQTCEQQPT